MRISFFLFALGLALLAPACGKRPSHSAESSSQPPAPSTNTQVFDVKGTVVELKLAEKTVRIKHEEIPGYMPAMTMPFEVKDVSELDRLEAGDPVSFRMIVTGDDAWIDQVRKLNAPVNTNLPTTGPFRVVRDVEPLELGDVVPDYRFTNHLGQPVHLHQFKGRAVAITFIFTRCPFPTFCPLMSNHFRDVQEQLLKTPGAPKNWHLLTISFDPDFDTPATLKAYAERYQANPAHWSFLTGQLMDITALTEQVGLMFWREGDGAISHNLRTVVLDTHGRVQRIFTENKWTAEELAQEVLKAAAVQP